MPFSAVAFNGESAMVLDLRENKKLVLWKRQGLKCDEGVIEKWMRGEKEAMGCRGWRVMLTFAILHQKYNRLFICSMEVQDKNVEMKEEFFSFFLSKDRPYGMNLLTHKKNI